MAIEALGELFNHDGLHHFLSLFAVDAHVNIPEHGTHGLALSQVSAPEDVKPVGAPAGAVDSEPTDLGIPAPSEADKEWHKPDWNKLSPDGQHEGMMKNEDIDPREPPGSGSRFMFDRYGRWVQDTPGGHWRWELKPERRFIPLP